MSSDIMTTFDSNRISKLNPQSSSILHRFLFRDVIGTYEPRISFIVYKGSQFFQTTKADFRGRRNVDKSQNPNSMVISAHVKGFKRVNLSNNLTGTFKKISQSQADKCVFWDFTENGQYLCFLTVHPCIHIFPSSHSISFDVHFYVSIVASSYCTSSLLYAIIPTHA